MAEYAMVTTIDAPNGGPNQASLAGRACPDDTNIHGVSCDDAAIEMTDSRRRNCLLCLFPVGSASEYKQTFKKLTVLSWPVVLYMMTTILLPMTSIIFSGHLGKDEIVAAALAQSVIHVFWRAILIGFTSGADTLFSQTYGSRNKKRVGIIFQRMLVLCTLLAIICWGILLNTEGVLLLFGQDPHIAQLASSYGIIFIAATPPDIVFILLVKFMESQSKVRPLVVFITLMGGLNIVLHFITVSGLKFGLLGAVGAQVITYYLGAIMLLVYIYKRKIHQETWPGWSWDCLQEWGIIMKLSVAGIGTVCLEWWCFEAGLFITGLLGKTAVGAHAVLFNTSGFTWGISCGFSIGATIMIGNYLGASKPTEAHLTACCCIIITVILGLSYAVFQLAVKDIIGFVFTKELDVVQLVASVLPIVAIGAVFNSGNVGCYGILRGCGYQFAGAVVCFLGYGIGLPLGVALTFEYGYGLKGLWLGMIAAQFVQFVLLMSFILFYINWDKEVIKAQKRAAVMPNTSALEYMCDGEMPLETLEQFLDKAAVASQLNIDELERNANEGPVESLACRGEHHGIVDGNTPVVGEVEQSELHQQDRYAKDSDTHENDCVERSEAEATTENSCLKDKKENVDNEEEPTIVVLTLDRLSFPQLIFRRGLALFICLAFLVVSIYISVYVVPAVRPTAQESVNGTANYTTLFHRKS